MNARTHGRLLLEADLSRAIVRDELFLQFQCQVAMASGAITGMEALVRWRHATTGVIPPGRFIPVAEESGLIVPIGAWVLEAACRQQAQWVRDGIAHGRMAVNVSAVQLRQPAFFDTVVRALERAGLDPAQLEMELTESVVVHGTDGIFEKLEILDKLGVTLAIDDFGTGQSNLSYLKLFPIRRVKIDRSFIRGLPEDTKNGALTQAIIGMGHALGMNVIAEGIETREQAEYLQSMWCDEAQGFLYSQPLLAADCADLLRIGQPLMDFPTPERE
jgi:EAL domain-containing protein (putative c-di-GMP-specific phosphodiesterase class I)